jgi:Antirestriction protein (ArdA)
MGNGGNRGNGVQEPISIEALLRQAAYEAWAASREEHQDSSREFFDRAYLGHYSSVDHYAETLVDAYQLDAKLDAAIVEPFREFVDIDIPALARRLVSNGTLYAITATPVGVWVFNGEIG